VAEILYLELHYTSVHGFLKYLFLFKDLVFWREGASVLFLNVAASVCICAEIICQNLRRYTVEYSEESCYYVFKFTS
jgi:hypothetical protein